MKSKKVSEQRRYKLRESNLKSSLSKSPGLKSATYYSIEEKSNKKTFQEILDSESQIR